LQLEKQDEQNVPLHLLPKYAERVAEQPAFTAKVKLKDVEAPDPEELNVHGLLSPLNSLRLQFCVQPLFE